METEKHAPSFIDMSQPQQERLAFIEFCLYFLGEVRRADVMQKFNIGPAGATRDFKLYRQLGPTNILLETRSKSYVLGSNFSPLFPHQPERVLTMLSRNFGIGVDTTSDPLLPCAIPSSLSRPAIETLATITRAIHRRKPVLIRYCSIESGFSERVLVPLALVDSGLRWHIRAFDRKNQQFRDFVITRIDDAEIVENGSVGKHECLDADIQWTRIVELKLIPHPSHQRPEIVRMDYGMTDEPLVLRVRAAHAGYLLQLWSVDCSPDHSLDGRQYQLWLKDPLTLYGVNNLVIAPGYKAPENTTGAEAQR
jgi:hypothetical protein